MANWLLDPMHTQVEFSVKHLGMMTVRGLFSEVSAEGNIDPDNPESSSVEAVVQMASIRTHNDNRDKDLQSSNILDVANHPTMTFKSTSVTSAGADRYKLVGDLTIRGTTRPITLEVTKYGDFNDPEMMGHRIGYGAVGKINRKDFGLNLNMILDGRLVIGEEIQIAIEGELVEQKA